MKLILVACFFWVLLFWELLFSQNKYYETKADLPLSNSAFCIIAENDSAFTITGGYSIDYGTFDLTWSYFAKLYNLNSEIPVVYYESDSISGDWAILDIVKTENGYLATGYIQQNESSTNYYIILWNLDSYGSIIEMKNITPFNDASLGYSITQNNEGNLFIAGYYTPPFMSPIRDKLYLTKLSPSGQKLWEYANLSYPNNCAFRAVLPADDGGCFAAGYVNVNPPTTGDFFFIKINSVGITVWEKVYSFNTGNGGANALGLASANDNSFVLCGSSNHGHARLLKTNAVGDSIWSREYFPNEQISSFLKVAILSNNNIVAIGSVKSYDVSGTDMLITKVDSLGNLMWHRRYGQVGISDYGYSFTPTIDPLGGFVIVGRSDTLVPTGTPGVNWSLGRSYIVKTNCMGLLTLPQAAFTISQDPDSPTRFLFTNQSQYAYPDSIDGGYYVLNWGDGSPPYTCGQGYAPCSQDTLTHIYQADGVYGVTLQAIVCNDTSTQIQSVCLGFSPNPQAAFSYQDFGGTILFTNLSQNAYIEQGGTYLWDFGDGSPPVSQEHPTHTYEENGSYTVTLTLVVCADTSVYTQEVVVQTVSLPPGILPPDPLKGRDGQFIKLFTVNFIVICTYH